MAGAIGTEEMHAAVVETGDANERRWQVVLPAAELGGQSSQMVCFLQISVSAAFS